MSFSRFLKFLRPLVKARFLVDEIFGGHKTILFSKNQENHFLLKHSIKSKKGKISKCALPVAQSKLDFFFYIQFGNSSVVRESLLLIKLSSRPTNISDEEEV